VYDEYSVKVFLKSQVQSRFSTIEQEFNSPGRNSFNSTTVSGDLNATTSNGTYSMADPC
jgi:hypothetical protein